MMTIATTGIAALKLYRKVIGIEKEILKPLKYKKLSISHSK
jgi:hypothetical protein